MEQINFIVELYDGAENRRVYVIKRLIAAGQPPVTIAICDSADELAQAFDNFKVE